MIAYNKNLVAANAVPRDYEDFLDAKWKGEFTLDTEDFEWFDFINKTRGNEAGLTLHRGIAANMPVMVTGGGSAREPLVAGEVHLITRMFDFTLLPLMQKGAPIDFVYPQKGALVTVAPIMLAKTAPNPAAAVLLMDWATSRDGQQAMVNSSGRTPVRADVTERDAVLPERARNSTLTPTDVLSFSSRFQDIQTQFASIYLKR